MLEKGDKVMRRKWKRRENEGNVKCKKEPKKRNKEGLKR